MIKELENCKYFDGSIFRNNQNIHLHNGMISSIANNNFEQTSDRIVISGFIDLQIYGSGGKLFSADPTLECLKAIEDDLLKKGTTSFLMCLATNTPKVFNECIKVAKAHRDNAKNCLGLHLEGPYLNAIRSGAHVKEYIRKATLDEVKALLDFGDGVIKMITIAPELQDDAVIQYLLDNDVVLSLGHSDATFMEATEAFDKGIQTTTHLFNAMSAIHHRKPGIPTAVFNHDKAKASIIADGHHVDFEVIKMSQKLLKDRLFLITDAVTSCSSGPYQHKLIGDKFVMPDGTLSGSNLTMLKAIKNCVEYCHIPLNEAINMATSIPATLIKKENILGKIDVGYQANLLVLDKELNLITTIFKGQPLSN